MKNAWLLLLLIIAAFGMTNCRAKMDPIQITNTQIDTVYIQKEVQVSTPIHVVEVQESVCDSMGILKAFKKEIQFKGGSISIQGENNQISSNIRLDSIKSEKEVEYKVKIKEVEKIVEVPVPEPFLPSWVWKVITIMGLLILLFLVILFSRLKKLFPNLIF